MKAIVYDNNGRRTENVNSVDEGLKKFFNPKGFVAFFKHEENDKRRGDEIPEGKSSGIRNEDEGS